MLSIYHTLSIEMLVGASRKKMFEKTNYFFKLVWIYLFEYTHNDIIILIEKYRKMCPDMSILSTKLYDMNTSNNFICKWIFICYLATVELFYDHETLVKIQQKIYIDDIKSNIYFDDQINILERYIELYFTIIWNPYNSDVNLYANPD